MRQRSDKVKAIAVRPPFFEIGPKAYLYGEEMLKLARAADEASEKYDVRVILTPQYTDIPMVVANTRHVLVFAQHMDPLPVGKGLGSVLPEAVKTAGAVGVMLNHAEKPMYLSDLRKAIHRAREVGLISSRFTNGVVGDSDFARFGRVHILILLRGLALRCRGIRVTGNKTLSLAARYLCTVKPSKLVGDVICRDGYADRDCLAS